MKLYLGPQSIQSVETTPTETQSTTMPLGTDNSQSWLRLRTSLVASGTQQTGNVTTLAQTARQDARLKPWLTSRLRKQTIPAQTWTFAFAAYQDNASANSFIVLVLYGWRPGTAAKVGTIYDNATALGNEYAVGTTAVGRVVTFAGAELAVEDMDYLVLEVWETNTQSMATSYSTEFAHRGSTDPTEGTSTTDAATYLESPEALLFAAPFPPTYAPRHLRNANLRR